MNFPTTPEIESFRAELQKAQASQVALSEKARALRERAPRLAKELAEAMADGDATRVATLRAERSIAEHDLRDLESASNVASERITAADTKLARAEWPLISETIGAAVSRLMSWQTRPTRSPLRSAMASRAPTAATARPSVLAIPQRVRTEHSPSASLA